MKQVFLKFSHKAIRFAPEINSRRMGLRAGTFHSAAYRSDGEGSPEDAAALLLKVKQAASDEINTRNYQNVDQVQNLVSNVLENVPLDALRKYNEDKSSLESSVRDVAAEVEKIINDFLPTLK